MGTLKEVIVVVGNLGLNFSWDTFTRSWVQSQGMSLLINLAAPMFGSSLEETLKRL
jgi:hypothetical protein